MVMTNETHISPYPMKKKILHIGLDYGDVLQRCFIKHRVFVPTVWLSLTAAHYIKPTVKMFTSFDNPTSGFSYTVTDESTIFSNYELSKGLYNSGIPEFRTQGFQQGMQRFRNEFGANNDERIVEPISVLPNIPTTDIVSLMYNLDARWFDSNRLAMAKYMPLVVVSYPIWDMFYANVFDAYRAYCLYRGESFEIQKRTTAAILEADALIYEGVFASLRGVRPEYDNPDFIRGVNKLVSMLQDASAECMKGIED